MNEEHFYDETEEDFDDEVQYYAVRPNKTKIKKDINALFELGNQMSALSKANLNQLALPQEIREAIDQVANMGQTGAKKRLLKFVAGKLHKLDAEILEAVTEQFARIKNQSVHAVREHHIAERWRDRLINEGDAALTDLLDDYPEADRQHLRQLLRNIQKETQAGQPPKSSRLLYRYLKTLLNQEEVELDDVVNEEDLEHDPQ